MLIGRKELEGEFRGLVKSGGLGHAYIFFGQPRGGKRTFALALANFLETGAFDLPEAGSPPLGDCLLVEPEANSLGIDKVRAIKEFLYQTPNRSARRTVVVDQGDKMTDEAQNAFLKIAEEPSSSALLIIVLDDPEKLRPTLLSRFQRMYFGPVGKEEIKEWLRQSEKIPADKAARLAEQSGGAPGLAHALLRDEKFGELLAEAKKYLGLAASARGAWIKELAGEEDFDFRAFLDAVLLAAAWKGERNPRFWHAALNLRREISYFNLNPRLQLLALAEQINVNSES